jgi:DNA-binding CsgD family transcriptional regulator
LISLFIYGDFIKVNGVWKFIIAKFSFLSISFAVYCYLTIILSCLILFIWYKKTDSTKDKKQSIIILFSLIIHTVISGLDCLILPVFTSYDSLSFAPIGAIILMIGIWYTIVKYKFLSITPELVSKHIIANINESIILLDKSLKIITINDKTKKLLNKNEDQLIKKDISIIIHESKQLIGEINNLYHEEFTDFSCRVNFLKKEDQNILMDIKTSIIKDKFTDVIGILIIGHEVKEMKQLRTIYQITDRESNVIQHILTGSTNKDIADDLGITERTIKTHLTNIYNKLGVDNRMQLLHLLKDFNLIPDKSADKTILFFNKK